MKGHHRVLWDKTKRTLGLQRQLDLLAQEKSWIGHSISHLDEVFDRKIGNRIRVNFSRMFKFREDSAPICLVTIEQLQKNRAVLESAVDSLSEERNDGMRGVSEQENSSLRVPRRTFDRHHRARRVGKEVIRQIRHQRSRIRKARLEEIEHR